VSSRAPLRALTIGAVLRALRSEFPDITISKIRFLESEGLVTPSRTASGYRTFSDDDVDRLRYVLAAQRDRFLPLRVIRESLEAIDRGLEPSEVAPGAPGVRAQPPRPKPDHDLPTGAALARASTLRLTLDELAQAADTDTDTLQALEGFGLLRPDATGHYGESALTVAHTVQAMSAYGLEPRHLRPFRTAADREVGLVEQVVGPLRRGASRRMTDQSVAAARVHGATDPAADLLKLCVALHVALVKAELESGRRLA
jgi:DNA-binding transcriptional MerR regulator